MLSRGRKAVFMGQAGALSRGDEDTLVLTAQPLPSEQHPPRVAQPRLARSVSAEWWLAIWRQELGAENALRFFFSAPLKKLQVFKKFYFLHLFIECLYVA